jgi:methylated-DNA-[protein]-cysteine S-methyltransferase
MCIVTSVQEVIYTANVESSLGTIRIASSERGLTYVGFPLTHGRGFMGWLQSHAPGSKPQPNDDANLVFSTQVLEFINGERKSFEFPVDLRATPFQQRVFKVVSEIPFGETLSYAEVASRAGDCKASRAVGAALGANPLPLVIPCHRVVGSGGKLQGYAGGLVVKAKLLAAEKIAPCNGRLF